MADYPDSMKAKEGGRSRKKITALVVDDDRVVRMINNAYLGSLGIENQVVCNGKEAVDVISSGKTFDLILMDRDMPVMNGIQATREIRAMGIGCKIVGLSARSLEEDKNEFMEAGLDDYQEKPLTFDKLVSTVQSLQLKSDIK